MTIQGKTSPKMVELSGLKRWGGRQLFCLRRLIGRALPTKTKTALLRLWEQHFRRPTAVGAIDMGELRRLSPISRSSGWDRGQPIDRYYIDRFLSAHSGDIRGHVLEAGDDRYTRQFGEERVTRSDILNVVGSIPGTTIVADLTAADEIPSDTFDCVILTQTIQMIYDPHAALRHVFRILRPGGTLLMTTHGISPIHRVEGIDPWGEYWHLTSQSTRRLCTECCPGAQVEIAVYGNVLSSIAWLHGCAAEDLDKGELDFRDPQYELLIGVRVVKPV